MNHTTEGMGLPHDDDELFEELREAFASGADLQYEVARQGSAIYAWHTVDDDLLLAELAFDSRRAQTDSTRGGEPDEPGTRARVLVFQAAPLSIELELHPDQVIGQILPISPGEVYVETAEGVTLQVEADEHGFFVLPALPSGAVRLRCDTATGRLRTDWLTF